MCFGENCPISGRIQVYFVCPVTNVRSLIQNVDQQFLGQAMQYKEQSLAIPTTWEMASIHSNCWFGKASFSSQ